MEPDGTTSISSTIFDLAVCFRTRDELTDSYCGGSKDLDLAIEVRLVVLPCQPIHTRIASAAVKVARTLNARQSALFSSPLATFSGS